MRLLYAAAAAAACSREAPKIDSAAVVQTGAALTASYDPATRTVTVVAKDFEFSAPDSVPGGWTRFRLVNAGPNLHHIQLVRLDSGKTFADLQASLQNLAAPWPKWAVTIGGPNGVDTMNEANATVNLAPGIYGLLCFVDVPDHVTHIAKGMVRALTVTAATNAGIEPTADMTMSLTEFAFTMTPAAPAAGKHVLKVVNDGSHEHELALVRLHPGKTMQDLGAWSQTYDGAPPGDVLGGMAGLMKGNSAYFDVDFTPGTYVALCFVPDAKTKKPHLALGMIKEFTVP